MEKKIFTLYSNYDHMLLPVIETIPEENIKGVVLLVHGMSEHKERYLPFMEYMSERGFACVIYDQRGHGEAAAQRKHLGYMNGGGGTSLVEDAHQMVNYCRDNYPGLPMILFSHSMGTLVSRAFMKKYDELPDVLILSGPPCKNPGLPFGKAIAHMEKRLYSDRHISKLIEGISFGPYVAKFAKERSPFAWICSNPKVVEEYDQSELCGFTFSDDAYLAMFDVMKETYNSRGWQVRQPRIPILYIAGEEDPCIGSLRKFKQSIDFMRSLGYSNIRGKIYPGMRHEILNEINREKVYEDIYRYIRTSIR